MPIQRGKDRKSKHFRVNIAKALIRGISSIASAKCRRIENLSVTPENKGKHFSCKIKGRKKVCVHGKKENNWEAFSGDHPLFSVYNVF